MDVVHARCAGIDISKAERSREAQRLEKEPEDAGIKLSAVPPTPPAAPAG